MSRFASQFFVAVFGALCLIPVSAFAQADPRAMWTASRAELESRVAQLDALAASTAYSARTRARSALEATNIRQRLTEGDFRVGDRIFVEIDGVIPEGVRGAAPTLSDLQDTLTVLDGARINIRNIGEVALVGVLRSELQARVNTAVNEVVLNSRALTRPLVRVAVFGSVGSPGYYSIPLETRLDNLIMLAGGPTSEASTARMRVMRGDTEVLSAQDVRTLIAEGAIVGVMGLEEGDQLLVERGGSRLDGQQTFQLTLLILSPIISTILLTALR